MKRPSYPRINCCVWGCKRGSTAFPPGTTMMCGKCWRRAPKYLRDRAGKLRKAVSAARRKGDETREERLYDLHSVVWRRIVLALQQQPEDDTMPPVMAEELRKMCL